MKRLFILHLTLILICSSAFAEIPLVLEATIQLPPNSGWDVQHWMSDSTFGWACVSGDTIFYVKEVGDAVQHFTIPQDAFWTDECAYMLSGHSHNRVMAVRLGQNPEHAYVVLQSEGDHYGSTRLVVSVFDLTASQLMGYMCFPGYRSENWGQYWDGYTSSINTIAPWPPPPQISHKLFAGWQTEEYQGHDTNYWWYSRHESYGQIRQANLDTIGWRGTAVCNGMDLSSFSNVQVDKLAISGEHHYGYQSSDGDSSFNSCWITTYDGASGMGPQDDTSGCVTVLAQQDGDGTERIITQDDGTSRALDASDYSLLWQRSLIHGRLCSAALEPDGNEYLLAFNDTTHRFQVYDAANGTLVDSTIAIAGSFDHVLKRPGRSAEFVTRDAMHIARVYGMPDSTPRDLTCAVIGDSNLIRLRWSALPGAAQYYVYSSSNPSTVEIWEGTVMAPEHSFDLVPEDHKRFYFVTAEYGDGGTTERARHAVPLRQTNAGRAR